MIIHIFAHRKLVRFQINHLIIDTILFESKLLCFEALEFSSTNTPIPFSSLIQRKLYEADLQYDYILIWFDFRVCFVFDSFFFVTHTLLNTLFYYPLVFFFHFDKN